jgi:hypothetical protein
LWEKIRESCHISQCGLRERQKEKKRKRVIARLLVVGKRFSPEDFFMQIVPVSTSNIFTATIISV